MPAPIEAEPYSPERLLWVVAGVGAIALLLTLIATYGIEARSTPPTEDIPLSTALRQTWADPIARAFTGFVFLSILAFYLSELVLEPFAGHVHALSPEDSTKLSGGKDGAALLGMIAVGLIAQLRFGSLRLWAIVGCIVSAAGLFGLGFGGALVPFTVILGLGNGIFVVGAIGSMMQLAAAHEKATGTRMGVFGAAQAIAAGLAGLIATGTLDIARLMFSTEAAYGAVFAAEAVLFLAAAIVAARVIRTPHTQNKALVPGE
jgi:BCD family chlorophyll transporter-like MFS transporter